MAILICTLFTFGCATRNAVPRLSGSQYDLFMAADELATRGGPVPKAIQDLHPVEVYNYRGNVVIALYRNDQLERGFYIIPPVSSYIPWPDSDPKWTFKPATTNALIWEYSRAKDTHPMPHTTINYYP